MLVDFRPTGKLRGNKPVDVTATLGPVFDALAEDSVDLSRVRVVCDWIQYRNNFRDVVDIRPILASHDHDSEVMPVALAAVVTEDEMEVAVDVRRSGDVPLKELTRRVIQARCADTDPSRIYLEPWQATSTSMIWEFNALYWKALDLWEQVTGQQYEKTLPGGQSDARNREAVREIITGLFALWDSLAERNALPDELYVVELGPGNGAQAKTWLDEFVTLDADHGTEYYRRLHYLMCDYSPHVLELARAAVADHAQHVSSFVLDATQPRTALGFLRYKIFLVYISNVYDNLPTDEVAQIGGRTYVVQSRAYLSTDAVAEIGQLVSAQPDQVPELISKLLRLGPALLVEALPAHFPSVEVAVEFWRRTWAALRLAERYVPLAGLDLYQIAPTVSGEMLRPLLESGAAIRMHVNNGAVASFVDTVPLLHPYGRLICYDLFVTDVHAYRTGFRGPGKYDGSIVNWLNGPLLAHIGRRKGFDVDFQRFAHRTGTNIVTMTAQVRD
ncbi:MAG: SAM-dependent methyltransferase [Actinomycetota bacterium]|nr:SAM-dependent methyltransferase [Actinomycetota bacterium]